MCTQIAQFMGPTWGPSGSCRPQVGPMLAPWTLLSGYFIKYSNRLMAFNKAVQFAWDSLAVPVMWCFVTLFIRPFEKRDVLCRGNVRPSVRLSVRPSVRPRFPDFSSTCFEISIWNLAYAFSRWHDMSSLICITIGSIWPSLQPKVGQTYFLQSWPHKSR